MICIITVCSSVEKVEGIKTISLKMLNIYILRDTCLPKKSAKQVTTSASIFIIRTCLLLTKEKGEAGNHQGIYLYY